MKKIAYLMCLLAGFFIAGCADDAGSSSADTDSSSADYSVDSTVKYGTASYYVVSNSFDSGAGKSALAARSAESGSNDDVSEMVKTVSLETMEKFTKECFGGNILLIRISGQVRVPYGKTGEYKSAYDAVTNGVSEDEVSEYFQEVSESSNKPYEVNYRDIYLVLDENKEQIGRCEIKWNRYQKFENGKPCLIY